jgi:hypothetical protein
VAKLKNLKFPSCLCLFLSGLCLREINDFCEIFLTSNYLMPLPFFVYNLETATIYNLGTATTYNLGTATIYNLETATSKSLNEFYSSDYYSRQLTVFSFGGPALKPDYMLAIGRVCI